MESQNFTVLNQSDIIFERFFLPVFNLMAIIFLYVEIYFQKCTIFCSLPQAIEKNRNTK